MIKTLPVTVCGPVIAESITAAVNTSASPKWTYAAVLGFRAEANKEMPIGRSIMQRQQKHEAEREGTVGPKIEMKLVDKWCCPVIRCQIEWSKEEDDADSRRPVLPQEPP